MQKPKKRRAPEEQLFSHIGNPESKRFKPHENFELYAGETRCYSNCESTYAAGLCHKFDLATIQFAMKMPSDSDLESLSDFDIDVAEILSDEEAWDVAWDVFAESPPELAPVQFSGVSIADFPQQQGCTRAMMKQTQRELPLGMRANDEPCKLPQTASTISRAKIAPALRKPKRCCKGGKSAKSTNNSSEYERVKQNIEACNSGGECKLTIKAHKWHCNGKQKTYNNYTCSKCHGEWTVCPNIDCTMVLRWFEDEKKNDNVKCEGCQLRNRANYRAHKPKIYWRWHRCLSKNCKALYIFNRGKRLKRSADKCGLLQKEFKTTSL